MASNGHVFRSYDIRGLVDGELSEHFAYCIGRAYACFLQERDLLSSLKSVVVGHDMRPTSIPFQKQVIQGIVDEGVNVVNIGLVSTPVFNFACTAYSDHAAGIMITASHNTAEYNGFKMTLANGLAIGKGSGMEELRELFMNQVAAFPSDKDIPKSAIQKVGGTTQMNVVDDYIARVFEIVSKDSIKPLKIVVDAGNGMAKVTFPRLLKQLPVEVEYLFLEPDGNFPNHEANPLKVETLKDLQNKVIESKADFGFALDGDADRVGLVDEKGEVVEASFVIALIGLEVLKDYPGTTMLHDLRTSRIVQEVWEGAGGSSKMTRVGHAYIKPMMKETGAVFASELSLHLYYKDMHNLESGDLSLLYLLQLLCRAQKPLSQLISPLKKFCHSGEINFTVEEKDIAMAQVEEEYKKDALEILHLDGIWMKFVWGWLSVRASNTESVLRLNLEAEDKKTCQEKLEEVSKIIKGI